MSTKEDVGVRVERSFDIISVKHTHGWLVENSKKDNYRHVVGGDVLSNVRELFSDIPINEGFFARYVFSPSHQERRYGSISLLLAGTFGSVAISGRWNMDSPPIVYMNGYKVRTLVERLKKETKSAPEVKDPLLDKMDNSLEEFARQKFPEDPAYIEILQRLSKINTRLQATPKRRDRFFELLNAGNYRDALLILPGDRKDVPERIADTEAKPFPTATGAIIKVLKEQLALGKNIEEIAISCGRNPHNFGAYLKNRGINVRVIINEVQEELRSLREKKSNSPVD